MRDVFRRLGIPVPEATHVLATINGVDRGLYEAIGAYSRKGFHVFEGDHVDYWQIGEKSSGPLAGLKPADGFPTNITEYIAAEYVTAHKDGFLSSYNNYLLFCGNSWAQSFLEPHTMDFAYNMNAPAFALYAKSEAAKRVLSDETMRRRTVELIAGAVTVENEKALAAALDRNQAMLLYTVCTHRRADAELLAREFASLSNSIHTTYRQLRNTARAELEDLPSAELRNDVRNWRVAKASTNASVFVREDKIAFAANDAEPAWALLECYEYVRRREFIWRTPTSYQQANFSYEYSAAVEKAEVARGSDDLQMALQQSRRKTAFPGTVLTLRIHLHGVSGVLSFARVKQASQ